MSRSARKVFARSAFAFAIVVSLAGCAPEKDLDPLGWTEGDDGRWQTEREGVRMTMGPVRVRYPYNSIVHTIEVENRTGFDLAVTNVLVAAGRGPMPADSVWFAGGSRTLPRDGRGELHLKWDSASVWIFQVDAGLALDVRVGEDARRIVIPLKE